MPRELSPDIWLPLLELDVSLEKWKKRYELSRQLAPCHPQPVRGAVRIIRVAGVHLITQFCLDGLVNDARVVGQ